MVLELQVPLGVLVDARLQWVPTAPALFDEDLCLVVLPQPTGLARTWKRLLQQPQLSWLSDILRGPGREVVLRLGL